jgi:hypothetical protein
MVEKEDDMLDELEWYGASVQLETNGIDWAYIEVKARSEEAARAKLYRMFRDGVKIIYCQLV